MAWFLLKSAQVDVLAGCVIRPLKLRQCGDYYRLIVQLAPGGGSKWKNFAIRIETSQDGFRPTQLISNANCALTPNLLGCIGMQPGLWLLRVCSICIFSPFCRWRLSIDRIILDFEK